MSLSPLFCYIEANYMNLWSGLFGRSFCFVYVFIPVRGRSGNVRGNEATLLFSFLELVMYNSTLGSDERGAPPLYGNDTEVTI